MPNILVGKNQVQYEQVGEGRNLVLLPTLLAEMTVYDEVIDDLSGLFRVTRVNFPGFGSSSGPVNQTVESYADLISETIKALSLPVDTNLIGKVCNVKIINSTNFALEAQIL